MAPRATGRSSWAAWRWQGAVVQPVSSSNLLCAGNTCWRSSCRHHWDHHLWAPVAFLRWVANLGIRHVYLRVDFDTGKFALKRRGKLDTLLRTFLVPFSSFMIILLRLTSSVGLWGLFTLETRASDWCLYGPGQICARASGICFTP